MAKKGRPFSAFDVDNPNYRKWMLGCNVLQRIRADAEVSKEYGVERAIHLVAMMCVDELRAALNASSSQLANLLHQMDFSGRPEQEFSSQRNLYYHFWRPGKIAKDAAQRMHELVSAEPFCDTNDVHNFAQRVAEEGVHPGRSDPIRLPKGTILKFYYQFNPENPDNKRGNHSLERFFD